MITAFLKFLFNIIRLTAILLGIALIFHTWVIRKAVQYSLGWQLGAPVEIGSVRMDWKNTGFEIHNLEIGNPYHYPAGFLADVPLVIVSIDITKIPEGILRFKAVGFNLRELVVMHAPGKGLNIMELKAVQRQRSQEAASAPVNSLRQRIKERIPHVVIDELIVSIGTITFVESMAGVQKEKRIKANIEGQTFYDLSGSKDIAYIVVTLAMKRLGYKFATDQLARFAGETVAQSLKVNLIEKLKEIIS